MNPNARRQLVDVLSNELPDTIQIIDTTEEIGQIDPAVTGVVQLFRARVAPDDGAGWDMTWEMWLVSPAEDAADIEDSLNELLDDLLPILDRLTFMTRPTAERQEYPAAAGAIYQAYKITFDTKGEPS